MWYNKRQEGDILKISVVIPVYNEEKILSETKDALYAFCKQRFTNGFEIIFSDDGSRDASRAISEGFSEPEIRVIGDTENRGKGYAVRQGILAAEGDIVIFTDCDLAYGTEILSEYASYFEKNSDCDVLVGSRALHPEGYSGYSFFRKILSRGYLRFLSLVGGIGVSDSQSGIKGFRRAAAREIFSFCESNRFAFDFEVLMLSEKLNYRVREYPVKIINNRPSSMSFLRDSCKMIRDVMRIKKHVRSLNINKNVK